MVGVWNPKLNYYLSNLVRVGKDFIYKNMVFLLEWKKRGFRLCGPDSRQCLCQIEDVLLHGWEHIWFIYGRFGFSVLFWSRLWFIIESTLNHDKK